MESSPRVEGLCALLPLARWAGGYKYIPPPLPSVHVWLLTLTGFLAQQHLNDQQTLIKIPC